MSQEFSPSRLSEILLNQEIERQIHKQDTWKSHELTDDRQAEMAALRRARLARTVKVKHHVLP